jgi:aldose 1-epimerase
MNDANVSAHAPSACNLHELSLNGVTLEVCTIGATITKLIVPNGSDAFAGPDDCVLGYRSPSADLLRLGNPCYLGAVVGRVANRIENGVFHLTQSSEKEPTKYQLDINNDPNQLHGGTVGFHLRSWDCEEIDMSVYDKSCRAGTKCLKFTLTSPDGDQHYPGGVKVSVIYSLLPIGEEKQGVKVQVKFHAELLDKETKATPINLAQHSYINLAGHGAREGILDHNLHLPSSKYYTPTNDVQIPTTEIRHLANEDPTMDFGTNAKQIRDALVEYGIRKMNLTSDKAKDCVNKRTHESGLFGFDHNYIVSAPETDSGLAVCAVLNHAPTKRCLVVRTDAPGMQVYTANFLDGTAPMPSDCKEGATYKKWQSICLETQHYPSSINIPGVPDDKASSDERDFCRGKCPILRPGGPSYDHTVEYDISWG